MRVKDFIGFTLAVSLALIVGDSLAANPPRPASRD